MRGLFTRQCLRESGWYAERLCAIERFQEGGDVLRGADIDARLDESRRQVARVGAPEYLTELECTIGADPFCGAVCGLTN